MNPEENEVIVEYPELDWDEVEQRLEEQIESCERTIDAVSNRTEDDQVRLPGDDFGTFVYVGLDVDRRGDGGADEHPVPD